MDVDLINIVAQEHKRHIQEISRSRKEHEIKSYFSTQLVDYSVLILEKYFDHIAKVYCKQNPYFKEDAQIFISQEFTAKKNKIIYSSMMQYAALGIRKLLDIDRGRVLLYKIGDEKADHGLLSEWIYWANKDDSMMISDLISNASKIKSSDPVETKVRQVAVINNTGRMIIRGWDDYAINTKRKEAF
ncbi:MAG TPA: hypothetical protein VEC16_03015 [Alphaproteobacteria bacterium]|nr:hypothetical protein [Alphaproteobacteria bacterium]